MGLDCNTEKGKSYIALQQKGFELLSGISGMGFVQTPVDCAGAVDGICVGPDGIIRSVLEMKCRSKPWSYFANLGSYLVTYEKLEKARDVGVMLSVPSMLAVYLFDAGILMWTKVANADGSWAVEIEKRHSVTKATCNGGEAKRLNAFIDLARFDKRRVPSLELPIFTDG